MHASEACRKIQTMRPLWVLALNAVLGCGLSKSHPPHSVTGLFGRSLTLHLAVASLKKIWQANQPIRRSAEKITSAEFILEIESKRISSGKISPPRSFGEPQAKSNPPAGLFCQTVGDATFIGLKNYKRPPRGPAPGPNVGTFRLGTSFLRLAEETEVVT